MHKNLTLALGGLVTIGVIAGASYFSGSSLLSSVLTTTTPPVCQEQENDVALARQALEQFPERANIAERITVLQETVRTEEEKVKELEQGAFAAAKKLRYPDLNTLMSDYQKYTELLTKKNNQNTQIRASNAEITRLSRIRPRTADISAQIKEEQTKLTTLKNELSKISKELSTLNAGIKKITRSSATIDVLYNKYLKKTVSELSSAQKALGEAQKALETVLAEQQPIRDAEAKLAEAENALKLCQKTLSNETGTGIGVGTEQDNVQYCYPALVQPDGTSTKECVTDATKIPPCYVKSELAESTYTDMDGNEQVSHSVKPDDNTKELYFCGTPEQYTDPSDPLKNYPTAPGAGSLGDGSQPAPAAQMGEGNPNDPRSNPTSGSDGSDYPRAVPPIDCGEGVIVYPPAQCPVCGNHECDFSETRATCPTDCLYESDDEVIATCGDGKLDEGEECDDGHKLDTNQTDACYACKWQCNWELVPNLDSTVYVTSEHPRSAAETTPIFVPFKLGYMNYSWDTNLDRLAPCTWTTEPSN